MIEYLFKFLNKNCSDVVSESNYRQRSKQNLWLTATWNRKKTQNVPEHSLTQITESLGRRGKKRRFFFLSHTKVQEFPYKVEWQRFSKLAQATVLIPQLSWNVSYRILLILQLHFRSKAGDDIVMMTLLCSEINDRSNNYICKGLHFQQYITILLFTFQNAPQYERDFGEKQSQSSKGCSTECFKNVKDRIWMETK